MGPWYSAKYADMTMYSQQFTLCYCRVESLRIRF